MQSVTIGCPRSWLERTVQAWGRDVAEADNHTDPPPSPGARPYAPAIGQFGIIESMTELRSDDLG